MYIRPVTGPRTLKGFLLGSLDLRFQFFVRTGVAIFGIKLLRKPLSAGNLRFLRIKRACLFTLGDFKFAEPCLAAFASAVRQAQFQTRTYVRASVAWNSQRDCFTGQICRRMPEVQIRRCELGLICSRGPGAAPPGAPANLRKLAVRNSEK